LMNAARPVSNAVDANEKSADLPLASVARQGAGLLHLETVLNPMLQVSPPAIMLGDALALETARTNVEWTITVRNLLAHSQAYRISQASAVAVKGYDPQTSLPLVNPRYSSEYFLGVEFPHGNILTLSPGQEKQVSVRFIRPDNVPREDLQWILSGYLSLAPIDAGHLANAAASQTGATRDMRLDENSAIVTVPYVAFAWTYSLTRILAPFNTGFPKIVRSDNRPLVQARVVNPVAREEILNILIRFEHPCARLIIDVIPVRENDTPQAPLGIIPNGDQLGIGSSDISDPTDAVTFSWTDGFVLGPGDNRRVDLLNYETYRIRVRALKAYMSPLGGAQSQESALSDLTTIPWDRVPDADCEIWLGPLFQLDA